MEYSAFKQEVFETTLDLVKIDLIRLSSGNVSMRLPNGNVAITPSGVLYSLMKPEDIVIIDMDGNKLEGEYKPSSEKLLHLEMYRARNEIMGVVHTHSIYSIAFSTVGMELPLVCIELISVGGPVPVTGYYCPGTPEVGLAAAEFIRNRPGLKGVLIKNHGMVAVGKSLQDAYQNAYKLETGAEIYHLALQTGRVPESLSDKDVEEIFSLYQRPKENAGK